MIYLWLAILGVVYVLIAVVVGKVCSMNSRWERTVDGIDTRKFLNRRRTDTIGRRSLPNDSIDSGASPVPMGGAAKPEGE